MKCEITQKSKMWVALLAGLFISGIALAQNAPSFNTSVTQEIYLGKGQQIIYIPSIYDGDGYTQSVSVTSAVSAADSVLTVDNIIDDPTYHTAMLYVTEQGYQQSIDISITLDDGTDTYTGDLTVDIVTPTTSASDGANFEYYNKAHWQPKPNEEDVPAPGSYEILSQTESPIANLEKDFFWQKMYGYIIPPKTASYIFKFEGNEGGFFYMNMQDGVEQEKKDTICEDTYLEVYTSQAYLLEGGKPYWFEAYCKDIVNSQPFYIKWGGGGLSQDFIQSAYLKTAVDFVPPTSPTNFQVLRKGLNDVLLAWSPSTDADHKIRGYNIYKDGELIKNEITDTIVRIMGLNNDSTYTFFVEAVDDYSNKSTPSDFLNVTTYDTDGTAPGAPQNVSQVNLSSDAVEITWDAVTDGETETWGYNIYRGSVQLNTEDTIIGTSFIDNNLSPENDYVYTVTALDGNFNESTESSILNVSTPSFEFEDPVFSENAKGIAKITVEPMVKFSGIGLQVGYGISGIISSNEVCWGHFEDDNFDENNLDLGAVNKKLEGASYYEYTDDPYDGNRSALISGFPGDAFRCVFSTKIYGDTYNYRIKFAAKRRPQDVNNLVVKLNGQWVSQQFEQEVTLDTVWQEYELVVDPAYDGAKGEWYLDFETSEVGAFCLDEVEFHIDEFYDSNSKFSTKAVELLEDFNPAGLRWGGIGANSEEFELCSGPYAGRTLSMADIAYLGYKYGQGYAYYSVGVKSGTDWRNNGNTFTKFMDYLGGSTVTEGGSLRDAEGYGNLLDSCKQIIIEFGNEVWGFDSHQANFNDYTEYGEWARNMSAKIKESSAYDPDKVVLAYSGRSPGTNYGLHEDMLEEEDGTYIPWLSLSGYMGGNMDLEPGVDFGDAKIDYHLNGYKSFADKIDGFGEDQEETLTLTSTMMPFYMYEGNMTTSSYFGTLGQGLTFMDYYTESHKHGVGHSVSFLLNGGQWTHIKDEVDFEPYPIFNIGALINTHCKGYLIESSLTTNRVIKDSDGATISLDPVGVHAFNDGENYSILLMSRSLTKDYQIMVDLPDTLTPSANATKYLLTGTTFDAYSDTLIEESISDFGDSIIVNVPKYSAVLYTFTAQETNFPEDIGYTDPEYVAATDIEISCLEGISKITTPSVRLHFTASVLPDSAFVQSVKWSLESNDLNCQFYNGILLAPLEGNDTLYVRADAQDGSGVYDTYEVVIKLSEDVEETSGNDEVYSIYPNPVQNDLVINATEVGNVAIIKDVQGKVVANELIESTQTILNMGKLEDGLYIIEIPSSKGTFIEKVIKK